jgi:hypothetical protein
VSVEAPLTAAQLLGRLDRATLGARDAQGGDFQRVLAQVAGASSRPSHEISVDPGLKTSLSDEDLRAIGMAADQAEAEGMQTALVMLDGRAVTLDVLTRTVTQVQPMQPGLVVGRVDGVVIARGDRPVSIPLPGKGEIENSTVRDALAGA